MTPNRYTYKQNVVKAKFRITTKAYTDGTVWSC